MQFKHKKIQNLVSDLSFLSLQIVVYFVDPNPSFLPICPGRQTAALVQTCPSTDPPLHPLPYPPPPSSKTRLAELRSEY